MSKVNVEDRYEYYKVELEALKERYKGQDKLEVIYELMKILMTKVDPNLEPTGLLNSHDENGNPVNIELRNERLKGTTIALASETMEFLNGLDWKWWKKTLEEDQWWNNQKKYDEQVDELADKLHFILQLAILMGIDVDDLFMAFIMKHLENMGRQNRGY